MNSPSEKISRLLGALHTLFDQQSFLLSSGHYSEARDIQDRCQPLVDEIVALTLAPGVTQSLDPAIQSQADLLLKKHLAQSEQLASAKAGLEADLKLISLAQSRTQRLRGAYREANPGSSSSSYSGSG